MTQNSEILFERKGMVEIITLNRPEALNALSLNMIRLLHDKLIECEESKEIAAVILQGAGDKVFCAGGDVKALCLDTLAAQEGKSDGALGHVFLREEYSLNHQIFHFSKPYISLLDGVTMGGGMGISAHGSHRIVTENTQFAMPETAIGFFPDVGGGYFLPRCPGETGLYLALTGARIGPADSMFIGLGTNFIPAEHLEPFIDDLATAHWDRGTDLMAVANAVISKYAKEPSDASTLDENILAIDSHFAFDSIEDILAELHADENAWAASTYETIGKMSPTSLKITLEQLRRAIGMDFEDIMTMEYRISQHCMAGHDFHEGVRAMLIDKDKAPKWSPATVEGVLPEAVEAYFKPLEDGELLF